MWGNQPELYRHGVQVSIGTVADSTSVWWQDKTDFHDRFIIIDGARVFHLGHSVKDAGSKAMMIHQLKDKRNILAAVQTFKTAWMTANPLPL